MKFRMWIKATDCFHYATEDMTEEQRAEAKACAYQYLKYGEEMEVEFDTEKGTATVLKID